MEISNPTCVTEQLWLHLYNPEQYQFVKKKPRATQKLKIIKIKNETHSYTRRLPARVITNSPYMVQATHLWHLTFSTLSYNSRTRN